MTDYDGWDEDDEQGQDQGYNPQLVKDLRKQLSKLSKESKGLEQELSTYRAKARTESIAEALKAAGVNEKVAKLVPADVAPDGVASWLKEYGDLFGVKPEQQTTSPPDGANQATGSPADQVSQLAAQQMKQMQDVAATGEAPGATGRVTTDALRTASSMEELLAMIQKGVAQGQ